MGVLLAQRETGPPGQVLTRCGRAPNGKVSRQHAGPCLPKPHRSRCRTQVAASAGKQVWVMAESKDVFTGCVEAGVDTFLVSDGHESSNWLSLASAQLYYVGSGGDQSQNGIIYDDEASSSERTSIGSYVSISTGDEFQALEEMITAQAKVGSETTVVVDATDWSIIPAENLVAAAQAGTGSSRLQLLMVASTAAEAHTLLGALEKGVDGVVLATDDVGQVREVLAHVRERERAESAQPLERATVTAVQQLPMGDRVCVDLCSRLAPGEGLLVGNFCRTLFLVHSECEESAYINSRPFRVNAGPVHAYVQASADKTAYLDELRAGASVLVVDHCGRHRQEVVGRCKVEARPLVMVTAATADGMEHSVILQNAETVKLVGPPAAPPAGVGPERAPAAAAGEPWRTVPVTDMRAGDVVLVRRSDAGRHMGIAVQEKLTEV